MNDSKLRRSFSRRNFLTGASALAISYTAPGITLSADSRSSNKKTFAYVGTYTGAVGAGSNGEGIYRLELNLDTGELFRRELAAKTPSPSWIAIHPSKKYLYAVNEVANYKGDNGSVSAFVIDSANAELSLLNTVSSEGAGPAHLSID